MRNGKQLTEAEIQRLIKLHDEKAGAFKKVRVRQSCWDAGIKIVKNCDCVTKQPYDIMFYPLAHAKIKKLQDMFPSLEWLAYLDGEIDHNKRQVVIKDLIIPNQIVTSVNVFNVEYSWDEGKNIVGVIHSHHAMGAFFSGTDDEYINQNHDVSIVVSTRQGMEIKGQVRVKADCDAYYINENARFSVFFEGLLDHTEFEAEIQDKISDKFPVVYEYHYPLVETDGGSLPRGNNIGFTIDYDTLEEYEALSEEDIRVRLQKYYSVDEVEEFIQNGEASEELMIMEQLVTLEVEDSSIDEDELDDLESQLNELEGQISKETH